MSEPTDTTGYSSEEIGPRLLDDALGTDQGLPVELRKELVWLANEHSGQRVPALVAAIRRAADGRKDQPH